MRLIDLLWRFWDPYTHYEQHGLFDWERSDVCQCWQCRLMTFLLEYQGGKLLEEMNPGR